MRIATVRATGSRYVVQQVDFKTNTVYCWGEVTAVKRGTAATHDASKKFPLAEVTLSEVKRTNAFLIELFEQAVEERKSRGLRVAYSGKKHITVTVSQPRSKS